MRNNSQGRFAALPVSNSASQSSESGFVLLFFVQVSRFPCKCSEVAALHAMKSQKQAPSIHPVHASIHLSIIVRVATAAVLQSGGWFSYKPNPAKGSMDVAQVD